MNLENYTKEEKEDGTIILKPKKKDDYLEFGVEYTVTTNSHPIVIGNLLSQCEFKGKELLLSKDFGIPEVVEGDEFYRIRIKLK